jgi:hypothetical protein
MSPVEYRWLLGSRSLNSIKENDRVRLLKRKVMKKVKENENSTVFSGVCVKALCFCSLLYLYKHSLVVIPGELQKFKKNSIIATLARLCNI